MINFLVITTFYLLILRLNEVIITTNYLVITSELSRNYGLLSRYYEMFYPFLKLTLLRFRTYFYVNVLVTPTRRRGK